MPINRLYECFMIGALIIPNNYYSIVSQGKSHK